ncbi:single-stranded-DNA-specific exonuclease RecJ [Cyanobium sp. Morenito 9A2]|uniref:single-stranded-DNA-specific exonuclease RecJ n=1 Tax=Cyanobium sp. Morenito 9A2 TaxID=2823718 RepID=UPI0020CF72E4|nr:single-stranded-DNA-specific exonuclease RecJ [Cyanobium sp. Morenito 9A2]MCP9848677.1 single-stranded-DNA-specific exonuclease RecJ [Cyanobium sp. Morenito 9A2]
MGSVRHAECGSPSAPPLLSSLPEQPWHLPAPLPALHAGGTGDPLDPSALEGLGLPDELLAVLLRRGFSSSAAIEVLLDPAPAPDAYGHFADLALAVARLQRSCAGAEAVAICGDYDADGMTSTALLVGVLQRLGARPVAAIPSRQDDGYGLNAPMVERLEAGGVRLLVTVDNGISARGALDRAQELGVEVILTDHHTLPAEHPPYLALLHPACTPEGSPYRGLAGVGLAYVLAQALCLQLQRPDALAVALDLFCIGTVADMAPLLGVNRRWLMDGLPRLGASGLPGLQALAQVAGLEEGPMEATTIGFQLAPRINAVGRLGDPRLVVELLTTEQRERAMDLARECEALNRQRKELCEAIEAEAVALVEADGPQRPAFLLLAQGHWHHGVIGIVAARLVERFGRPVALLASEGHGRLRASVRSPKGFAVDQALQECAELLERFGGHPAAGGFTVRAERVAALQERLEGLAQGWLAKRGEGLPLEPEAHLPLGRIDRAFWQQMRRLEPFGVGLAAPLFWCSRCRVLEQRLLRGGHLQLTLEQGESRLRAIAWRWQGQGPVPEQVDVAFRLRLDRWQGQERLQLELAGVRCSGGGEVLLRRRERSYWCRRQGEGLLIRNAAGEEVQAAIAPTGTAGGEHPYIRSLLQEAAVALGLVA